MIAEYDFVQNDTNVDSAGEDHGTATFSNVGGWAPGQLIGSAFGAHYLLAKTVCIRNTQCILIETRRKIRQRNL